MNLERNTMQGPIGRDAKVGQYLRFDIFGRFLRYEDYLTNGLGLIYEKKSDSNFERVFY